MITVIPQQKSICESLHKWSDHTDAMAVFKSTCVRTSVNDECRIVVFSFASFTRCTDV